MIQKFMGFILSLLNEEQPPKNKKTADKYYFVSSPFREVRSKKMRLSSTHQSINQSIFIMTFT